MVSGPLPSLNTQPSNIYSPDKWYSFLLNVLVNCYLKGLSSMVGSPRLLSLFGLQGYFLTNNQ